MKKFNVGSITYAIKGRDLLRKKGFKARIEKNSSGNSGGCGYLIAVEGDGTAAAEHLYKAGIKILN